MVQLTKRQIARIEYECLGGKRHWTEKKKHCIGIIRSFYKEITEDKLQWFLETFIPSENKRIKRQYFLDSQSGKKNTHLTPTDVDGSFEKEENPVCGKKYHLSWAFKGAVFVLCKIEGEWGYVDNVKNKRANYLKIKLSDLRKIREGWKA